MIRSALARDGAGTGHLHFGGGQAICSLMLAKVVSAAVTGIEAYAVEVEVDSGWGQTVIVIVGLPDAAVKESRDRVTTALSNSGFKFPLGRTTINLAPADVKKEGPSFDLPIAIGMLAASEQLATDQFDDSWLWASWPSTARLDLLGIGERTIHRTRSQQYSRASSGSKRETERTITPRLPRRRPGRYPSCMATLYYGDNLHILRHHLADESVDLVYLDPPFNSAQNYNAFFQEKDGSAASLDETFKKAPAAKRVSGQNELSL